MSRSERSDEVRSYVKSNWQLYAMLLIPVAFVLIFKYAAYPGLRIAFMNYKPAKGYAGSAWVGAENFQKIFRDKDFLRALKTRWPSTSWICSWASRCRLSWRCC